MSRSKRVNQIILCYTVQDKDQFPCKSSGSWFARIISYDIDMAYIIMYCQEPYQLLTACAARVTVLGLVCLSVCLSVDDYSHTTGYEAAYERYQQLQCYKGMKNNVAILLKRLRSRDMA